MSRQFRDAHIYWVTTHRQFIQGTYVAMPNPYDVTDTDVLRQMYFGNGDFDDCVHQQMERLAKHNLTKDMNRYADTQVALAQILLPPSLKDDIFLTIGFNHQTWNVQACKDIIDKIMNLPFIEKCEAVFEYYRENGQHPHCHFYIVTTNKIPKSKVLEKVWAVAGIKKVVLNKNFIDFKIAKEQHKGYVRGVKRDDKLQYVGLDRIWREANNIPHLFVR